MKQVSFFLWRGPRPKSAVELFEEGFNLIIDLQSGIEDEFSKDAYTMRDKFHQNEFSIMEIPCSNIFPPNEIQVNRFILAINPKKKTYVHCHSGVDRTGFMIAVYRMKFECWSFEDAYNEFVKMGRHWWFFWWKRELRKWASPL